MSKKNMLKTLDAGSYFSLILASILLLIYEFVGEILVMRFSVIFYGAAFLMLVVLCVLKLIYMKNETKEIVFEILEELCGKEIVDLKESLSEDLVMDSLQKVMLLVMLEERLDIELDESDMNPFDLFFVEDVVKMAEKYVAGKESEVHGE